MTDLEEQTEQPDRTVRSERRLFCVYFYKFQCNLTRRIHALNSDMLVWPMITVATSAKVGAGKPFEA